MEKQLELLDRLYREHALCARAIGLNYVADSDGAGWRRSRRGQGFTYLDGDGRCIRDPQCRQRLAGLGIPPAWIRVWLCRDPLGHIQATGWDQDGRKQYIYHPQWVAARSQIKFYHLLVFGSCLPAIRRRSLRLMANQEPGYDSVLGALALILDKGSLRIGNEVYLDEHDTMGLTTLGKENVSIRGPAVHFHFIGKADQERRLVIRHAGLGRFLQRLARLPGERLFCYLHPQQGLCPIQAADVNLFLQQASPYAISSKDFRTWNGTLTAFRYLLRTRGQVSSRGVTAAVATVAEALGNTKAVARQAYIHPHLLDTYQSGRFFEYLDAIEPVRRRAMLSLNEARMLAFLQYLFVRESQGIGQLLAAIET